jgi:DNA-binding Xre family transcriptional regulator
MTQIAKLLTVLKKQLKSHGITYAAVATHLQLTEASVKRLFSQQQMSLQRLEKVCQLMGMQLTDLLQLINEQNTKITKLTLQQEEEITRDLVLLLVTVSVLNRWTMQDILAWYQISEYECLQKLIKLDRLKIIELLPQNRIKLRIAANFSWREGGPIQRFFQENIAREFFKTGFEQPDECLLVLNGMLSHSSNVEFQRKLTRLAQEFSELNQHDATLPLEQRFGVTVVMAIRDWRFGLFKPLLKQDR